MNFYFHILHQKTSYHMFCLPYLNPFSPKLDMLIDSMSLWRYFQKFTQFLSLNQIYYPEALVPYDWETKELFHIQFSYLYRFSPDSWHANNFYALLMILPKFNKLFKIK
jgi:hypothetical protein